MIVSCKEKEITLVSEETFLMTRDLEEVCTFEFLSGKCYDYDYFEFEFMTILNSKKIVPGSNILVIRNDSIDCDNYTWNIYSLSKEYDSDEIVTFIEDCLSEAIKNSDNTISYEITRK